MDPTPARQIATTLRIMRIALTGTVLGVAVVASRFVDAESLRAEAAIDPGTMRWLNIAFLVGAMVVILAIQRRHEREADPRRRQTLNILAWAAGETSAFVGIVHWMLVGDPLPFYVGLGMMLASFVLVPIRE